ncbi:MAG: hypothetical protein LUE11_11170 [Clostridia bacterium]|nr:hypothetical protein [Clostridia bacterium]
MGYVILCIIFYGIPIAALLFFIISLYRYLYAKGKNKTEPNSFSAEEMEKRKSSLKLSSVIAGVLALVIIGLAVLLFMAIAYM